MKYELTFKTDKGFVVIDKRTDLKWANEFFKTEDEAIEFCNQNNLKL
jgi:hypothetical protein